MAKKSRRAYKAPNAPQRVQISRPARPLATATEAKDVNFKEEYHYVLEDLRRLAEPSRDALQAGDFVALGRIMVENTEAQRRLHPDLVGADARRVIDVARAHGALGWQVNGAGGEGGSVTLLAGPSAGARRAMIREIEAENPLYRHVPTALSRHGLRTWEVSAARDAVNE